jgi:sugar/nucleoside kinase (ribokinase family)
MPPPDVLCIGSVHWDVLARPDPRVVRRVPHGADVPGRIVTVPGGTALNVAVALRRLGLQTALLGAVGRDAEGDRLVERCRAMGLATGALTRTDDPTDRFVAIEGSDGVIGAVADARSLEAAGSRILAPLTDGRIARPWRGPVVLDGNVTEALLREVAVAPALAEADLRVVPASPEKAPRLNAVLGHPKAALYLTLDAAAALLGRPVRSGAEAAEALLRAGAARVVIADGPRGSVDATPERTHLAPRAEIAAARPPEAGAAFVAAHLAAELRGRTARRALTEAAAAEAAGEP